MPSHTGFESNLRPTVRELFIELTSNCNLRCRHCAINLPGYIARDMASRHVDQVVAFVERTAVPVVSVNAHGETTQFNNWVETCERLRAAGAQLNIVSNFARYFNEREVAALAAFEGIRISLESVDRDLLRDLRRHVDLRIVLHNLTRIRAHALVEYGRIPLFGINCVVSDLNVLALPDVAAFAAANGFADLALHDLAELTGLPDDRPRHILSLPPERLAKALDSLRATAKLAARLGLRLNAQSNLVHYVEEHGKMRQELNQATYFKNDAPLLIMPTPVAPGMTRNCLDPWRVAKIAEDGAVMTCCIGRTPIGHLDDGSLERVFQGKALQMRRNELLSGNLCDECLACPVRAPVPVAELRAKLSAMVE
ncbi:MAG: radical SAM/SPASM domain-containing protein [Sulfuricellaceae bacterium]